VTEIGLAADGLLIVLLAAAMISVHRLNKRMAELRDGRAAFEKLTADLAVQTKAAADGLAAFRGNAETLGKQLEGGAERGRQVIAEVQHVSDDLRLLIGRADQASVRLEQSIAEARRNESVIGASRDGPIQDRPVADRKPQAAPARGEPSTRGAETEVSPEAAAFLSSLTGMR